MLAEVLLVWSLCSGSSKCKRRIFCTVYCPNLGARGSGNFHSLHFCLLMSGIWQLESAGWADIAGSLCLAGQLANSGERAKSLDHYHGPAFDLWAAILDMKQYLPLGEMVFLQHTVPLEWTAMPAHAAVPCMSHTVAQDDQCKQPQPLCLLHQDLTGVERCIVGCFYQWYNVWSNDKQTKNKFFNLKNKIKKMLNWFFLCKRNFFLCK